MKFLFFSSSFKFANLAFDKCSIYYIRAASSRDLASTFTSLKIKRKVSFLYFDFLLKRKSEV